MTPDRRFNSLIDDLTEFNSEMDHAAIHLLSALYSEARNIVAHKNINELVLSSALTDVFLQPHKFYSTTKLTNELHEEVR